MIETPKLSKPDGAEKGPRWFQVAVALSMVLSAGAGLVSALRTSETMKGLVEQNARLVKAGSTPIVQGGWSNLNARDEPEVSLMVENVGTGPARIYWFEVKQDGKPVQDADALLILARDRAAPNWQLRDVVNSTIAGQVMTPGRSLTALRFHLPHTPEADTLKVFQTLDRMRQKLSVEACYCSVFDECWVANFGEGPPTPVARCERKDHTNFNYG